ncbi:MAG: Bax inhibitor-1/YccA family protein [Myxococcota bacterium]|nr:Bax inhibitor-1/YccA family protein [Myxococcota bacterium]
MRSSNPSLNEKVFANLVWEPSARMTLQGTVTRSLILLALVVGAAGWSWHLTAANPSLGPLFWLGGMIGGLVIALITVFKKNLAPFTAPLYAIVEGLFLGAFSLFVQDMVPPIPNIDGTGTPVPIVAQAVGLTFGTFGCMLFAYVSRVIKPTENFKLGVAAATGGIFLVYMASFVLSFFGISIPYLHEGGVIGIGVSVFIVVIAALNLVLDFDFIENACEHGAPKYMEWYGAFGLLVTLIWLYVEFLRLLLKLNRRR